eukprot:jgi/Botrbrau1/8094/Bobra.0230s0019.1
MSDGTVVKYGNDASSQVVETQERQLITLFPPSPALDYLWGAVQSRLGSGGGKKLGPGFLARQVVTWLVAPKTLDRPALLEALQALGLGDVCTEAARADLPALRDLLVQALTAGEDAARREAKSAAGLVAEYARSFAKRNPVRCILPSRDGASADLLGRADGSVSVVRDMVPLEKLLCTADAWAEEAGRIGLAGRVLGDLAPGIYSVLPGLLLEGFDLVGTVVPALLGAIMEGPILRQDSEGEAAPLPRFGRRGASEWHRSRSKALLQLNDLLSTVPNLVAALQGLLLYVAPHVQVQALQPTGTPAGSPGPGTYTCLTAAAQQLSRLYSRAAVEQLLLLAYLNTCTLPSTSVPAAGLAAATVELREALDVDARLAGVLGWLALQPLPKRAHRNRRADAPPDMTTLRLGSAIPLQPDRPPDASSASPPEGQAAGLEDSAALDPCISDYFDRFLASPQTAAQAGGTAHTASSSTSGSLSGLASCVLHFVAHVMCTSDPLRPLTQATVSDSVIHACTGLFQPLLQEGRLAMAVPLASLVVPGRSNYTLKFLEGLAHLNKLGTLRDPEARQRCGEEAEACLFGAAPGLGPAPKGGHAYVGRQRLMELLQIESRRLNLQPDLTGQQGELLFFYEVAVAASRRAGSLETATKLCLAAVRAATEAVPPSDSMYRPCLGHLWTQLFSLALDSKRYLDAYAAVVENPDPELQIESLRRLIGKLCVQGHVATLLTLPFSGLLDSKRDGRAVRLSLLEEAHDTLKRRAEHSDINAQPQPYKVLYSFCVTRGDYRGAALGNAGAGPPPQRGVRLAALHPPFPPPGPGRSSECPVAGGSDFAWLEDPMDPDPNTISEDYIKDS